MGRTGKHYIGQLTSVPPVAIVLPLPLSYTHAHIHSYTYVKMSCHTEWISWNRFRSYTAVVLKIFAAYCKITSTDLPQYIYLINSIYLLEPYSLLFLNLPLIDHRSKFAFVLGPLNITASGMCIVNFTTTT